MPSVVLGVTGGIAAYKAADILRGLLKEGAEVTVVMTRNARRFITPLTLSSLSGRGVIMSSFDVGGRQGGDVDIEHIGLARSCDLLLVAPATADVIAKMAAGIADDFLTTFCLAVRCPVLVAPAMNPSMWTHPVVVRNVETLTRWGIHFIGPEHGPLAGRTEGDGVGRLAHPDRVVARSMELIRAVGSLSGRRVLVTAGPTREPIDPVRFLSNASTGKMGFAVAEAARDLGADVTLVTGPSHLADPKGIRTIRVESAEQMREAVMGNLAGVDVLVKAAAVSDFRPAVQSVGKVKKDRAAMTLDLEPTRDILAEVGRGNGRFLVGFAAETESLVDHARRKLDQKGLDLIVANDVKGPDGAFGSDDNEVTILEKGAEPQRWPRMSKREVARRLMSLVAERLS